MRCFAALSVALFLWLLLGACTPFTLATEEAYSTGQYTEKQKRVQEELESIRDPTIILNQIIVEAEYANLHQDAWQNRLNLRGIYGFGPSGRNDWVVRLEVPVVYNNSGDMPGGDTQTGLGDIDLILGKVFEFNERLRLGGFLGDTFNTSTDDQLGGHATLLTPITAVSYSVTNHFNTILFLEYNNSIQTDSGVGETNSLEIRPIVTFDWPNDWSTSVEYKEIIDFAADNAKSSRLTFEVSKLLGLRQEVGIYGDIEVPLDLQPDNYTAHLGYIYFFK